MIKILNFKVSVEESRKHHMGLGGWIELKHNLVINKSITLENQCDLLIPLQRFYQNVVEFMHEGRNEIQIDPNGGALNISVRKHGKNNLEVTIRKNNYSNPEILVEGLIDKSYFFLTMTDFYYKSLDFLIPSDSKDKEFLKNLANSLKRLKNEIEKEENKK